MSEKSNGIDYSELSYEEALAKLAERVAVLEKGTLPLEKTMDAFKEGMELLEACEKKLDEFEGKLCKLVDESKLEVTDDI